MQTTLLKRAIYSFIALATAVCLFSGCEKMAGSATGRTPSTTTTTGTTSGTTSGSSSIAIGGVNTIIFQIAGGTTHTFNTSGYFFGINNIYDSISKTSSTTVSGFDITTSNIITLSYNSILSGTYPVQFITINLSDGTNIQQQGTSEKVKVAAESISNGAANGNAATGTVSGTFDGYARNIKTNDSVRVVGSFNLSK